MIPTDGVRSKAATTHEYLSSTDRRNTEAGTTHVMRWQAIYWMPTLRCGKASPKRNKKAKFGKILKKNSFSKKWRKTFGEKLIKIAERFHILRRRSVPVLTVH